MTGSLSTRALRLALLLLGGVLSIPGARAQAPVLGARVWLYVEPHEIRQETLLKVLSFREQLGIAAGAEVIESGQRAGILATARRLAEAAPVASADGEPLRWELHHVDFVIPDPENGMVPDTREAIPLEEAILATRMGVGRADLPGEIALQWKLFPDNGMPTSVDLVAPGGEDFHLFHPGDDPFPWRVPASPAGIPPLPLPAVPEAPALRLPWLALGLLGLSATILAIGLLRRRLPAWAGPLCLAGLAGAVLAWRGPALTVPRPLPASALPGAPTREIIVEALLERIYHAFDHRDPEAVYDALATSLRGPLLEQTYLQLHRSLSLENQGGIRIRIREVSMRDTESEARPGHFRAESEWVVIGDVTHWGHQHMRVNRYRATMTVAPDADGWRIESLALLEEDRM